jgi:hypothetical protein
MSDLFELQAQRLGQAINPLAACGATLRIPKSADSQS